MNQAIAPGHQPPSPGVDKEEPELSDEEDIPSDDRARDQGEVVSDGWPHVGVEREWRA